MSYCYFYYVNIILQNEWFYNIIGPIYYSQISRMANIMYVSIYVHNICSYGANIGVRQSCKCFKYPRILLLKKRWRHPTLLKLCFIFCEIRCSSTKQNRIGRYIIQRTHTFYCRILRYLILSYFFMINIVIKKT